MTSTLRRGEWGVRQKWDVIRRRVWGCLARVLDVQSLFFLTENWICSMIRHHANNILVEKNLLFDSDIRQWSHPLMILLNFFWTKSNNRTCGQFECDVTFCFLFLFDFVHSHARCGCYSIVCLHFVVIQIEKVDCKMSNKKKKFKQKNFVIFLDTCTHTRI